MARTLTKNHEHYRRALQRLPLGVASNFRFWGEERTIYVKQGRGARITDLDGNVYVDYRMGYGPAILGYADPRVDAAARAGMEVGGVFALSTEREYNVAERIAQMVPAAELVRFSNSGTEAVMAALRLARAYTRKDDYVILEGSYHGLFDAAMWFTPMDKWKQIGDPEVYPYSEGVPLSTRTMPISSRTCSSATATRSRACWSSPSWATAWALLPIRPTCAQRASCAIATAWF